MLAMTCLARRVVANLLVEAALSRRTLGAVLRRTISLLLAAVSLLLLPVLRL